MANPKPPISRISFNEEPHLISAAWWQETMIVSTPTGSRRGVLIALGGFAAVGLLVGFGVRHRDVEEDSSAGDGEKQISAALTAQREHGWNFGALAGDNLSLPDATTDPFDPTLCDTLATDMTPSNPALRPFYVPTLLESLSAKPTNVPEGTFVPALRDIVHPIKTSQMAAAFGKGRALSSLYENAPAGRAVVVDLPGPEAVAFAAAVSDRLTPVFLFDNWPHPKGVVPAHLTLAAMLTYAKIFTESAKTRPTNAPPIFVLDSNRLASYSEEANLFDNRYVAKLPSAAALEGAGVKQLLYVRGDENDVELDDVNADLVGWTAAGLEVRKLPTSTFVTDPSAPTQAKDGDLGPSEPGRPARTTTIIIVDTGPRYYYSSYHSHWVFWHHYGWGTPRYLPVGYRIGPSPMYSTWRPISRPTVYVGAGYSKGRPPSFGTVGVVRSGSSGRVTGGSFGRTGGSGGSA